MSSSADGHFLTAAERRDVEALAERIFPADAEGPGAEDLGVAEYIDRQLAGPWGQGAGLYRRGPIQEADHPGHGWQSGLTPAEVYRLALRGLAQRTRARAGTRFAGLRPAEQDELLEALAAGRLHLGGGVSAAEFWALLRQNVIEGLFSDPCYGGNRAMGGWRWLGYPGVASAHGSDYANLIDHHDEPYEVEPEALP